MIVNHSDVMTSSISWVEHAMSDAERLNIAPGRMDQINEALIEVDQGLLAVASEVWEKQDPELKQLLARAHTMTLKVLEEMVVNVPVLAERGIAPEMSARFYTKAIRAAGNIIRMHLALRNSDRVSAQAEMATLGIEEWQDLEWGEAVFANSPISQYLIQQEWLVNNMWHQRYVNIPDLQEWLKGFCDHVVNTVHIYEPKVGEILYSADAQLERVRIVSGLNEVITEPVGSALFFGTGNAQRVDGPVKDDLIRAGKIARRARVIGLDLLPQTDMYPGFELIQGDLATPNEQIRNLFGKMQLLTEIGSPRSNMWLYVIQEYYWEQLAKLAAPGAILIMDDADLEAVQDDNRRVRQTQKMEGGVVGMVPVQPAYRREGEDERTPGALIMPLMTKLLLARQSGWECINLPEMGSGEWWELMHNIMDKEWLKNQTLQVKNANKQPFYFAGDGVDGGIYRSTLIFRKVSPQQQFDLIAGMSKILLARQEGPSPV